MDHEPPPPSPDEIPKPQSTTDAPPHEYDSAELMHGAKEVLIRHAGELYRLRLTKNDKLILQK